MQGSSSASLVRRRDLNLGISTAARRNSRSELTTPVVETSANGWESGRNVQTRLEDVEVRR
jgi:hypothetical protein